MGGLIDKVLKLFYARVSNRLQSPVTGHTRVEKIDLFVQRQSVDFLNKVRPSPLVGHGHTHYCRSKHSDLEEHFSINPGLVVKDSSWSHKIPGPSPAMNHC